MKLGDFIGQNNILAAIKEKLKKDKIGHAYLFSGPLGQGKKTFATLFAKGILCLNRKRVKEEGFCDECISCIKVDKDLHPDLLFIEPYGKSIKIDQIRDLKKELSFKPTEAEKKVYIFEDAHTMSLEAANSMLNILEEPPGHVVSILITTDPTLLLPTILSRCEIYRFTSIPPVEMYEYFKNNINYFENLSEHEIKKAVSLSQGSLRKAKDYLEDGLYVKLEKQVENLLETLFEPENYIQLLQWAQFISEMEDEELDAFFEMLTLFLRELFVYKVAGMDEILIGFDNIEFLSNGIDAEKLEKFIDNLRKTRIYLNSNVNRVLALEGMLLEIKEEIING